MTGELNEAMREGIPEEWRTSTTTPIYKQKGYPLKCNNFRGIKLLSHTLKLWERVVESRLRIMVDTSERQYGFQAGKSTIQPLFCLRMLQEKHREFVKELHVEFPTGKVNDPTIVLLTDATRKTQRVCKGAACGICGPGKGIWQGIKGANMVSAHTKNLKVL